MGLPYLSRFIALSNCFADDRAVSPDLDVLAEVVSSESFGDATEFKLVAAALGVVGVFLPEMIAAGRFRSDTEGDDSAVVVFDDDRSVEVM